MIKDTKFSIYSERYVHLSGKVSEGCLCLDSYVYGDDYDSEAHYLFSKEETEKLFQMISLDEFIELGRQSNLLGMLEYLNQHGIVYTTCCI